MASRTRPTINEQALAGKDCTSFESIPVSVGRWEEVDRQVEVGRALASVRLDVLSRLAGGRRGLHVTWPWPEWISSSAENLALVIDRAQPGSFLPFS